MPNDLNDLDPRLAERLHALRDTPPEHDLWQGISARLSPRRPRGTVQLRWPVALAAGLALVVASAAGTIAVIRHRVPTGPGSPAGVAGVLSVAPVAYSSADSALVLAIQDFETRIRAALPQLDPTTRRNVERSLTTLDGAARDAAVERSAAPDDPGADRFFISTLRKKLAALQTIATLTASRS